MISRSLLKQQTIYTHFQDTGPLYENTHSTKQAPLGMKNKQGKENKKRNACSVMLVETDLSLIITTVMLYIQN